MRDFWLDLEYQDDTAIVTASGEIDAHTAPRLEERLQKLIADGSYRICVDLSYASYMDSEGLKVLIRAQNTLGSRGHLSVRGAHGTVRRVFEISGLDRLFRDERRL